MRHLSEKSRTAIFSSSLLIIWLIFGSSVSILSPTNGGLGALFACLSSLLLCLGPVMYVKARNIKVKSPKPLFVEPSAWLVGPLSLITSGFTFFTLIVIISIPPLDFIGNQMDKDTFIGTFASIFIFLFSMIAPICAYAVYSLTHYKRVVQYRSAEWKKVKAKNRANQP